MNPKFILAVFVVCIACLAYADDTQKPTCKIDYEVYWLHHLELTEKLAISTVQSGNRYGTGMDVSRACFDLATDIMALHGVEPKPYVPPDKRPKDWVRTPTQYPFQWYPWQPQPEPQPAPVR